MDRKSTITRKTKETDIELSLTIDGMGKSEVNTGIGFLDHMLESFAQHGLFDLNVKCDGDLVVDCHHTVEDIGIALGTAIKDALGDKKGITRYGSCILPMDESLVLVSLDLCGRPYYVGELEFESEKVGYMDTETVKDFFYSVSYACGMNLHIQILQSGNSHHVIEAIFKAFAKALDRATINDPRIQDVLSTKGSL